MYHRHRRNPFLFLLLSLVGIACGLCNIVYIIPFCGFLVAFCNGAVYSQVCLRSTIVFSGFRLTKQNKKQSARLIDQKVPSEFALTATSIWLFVGDVGSVTGSNLISEVDVVVKALPWFKNGV